MTVPVPPETIAASLRLPDGRAQDAASAGGADRRPRFTDLARVALLEWQALHARAAEANAYHDPLWALPVAEHVSGPRAPKALLAWHPQDRERLVGLLPVQTARQAMALPVPMLVGWSAYAPLCLPTLDRDCADAAAAALLDAAAATGAQALLLPLVTVEGAAFAALRQAAQARGSMLRILRSHRRAGLDATRDADALLRDALGTKKLKELRRQRHRLEDRGRVALDMATSPASVAQALEGFLRLEAAGWKGRRGTAMIQNAGEAAFIRKAATAMAAQGRCEIASLTCAGRTVAAGLLLRDRERAFFFKIAMDESVARHSPGVQLTLDITQRLCADARIAFADSTADFDHAMIDHIWRERIVMADVLVPLTARKSVVAALRLMLEARYRALELYRSLRRQRA